MAPLPVQPISGNPQVSTYHYETPAPATGPAFVVSRGEVLAKHAALLAEADDFQRFLDRITDRLFMQPCGLDPVSIDVARSVTYRISNEGEDSYFTVCQEWVNNLYQAAETLADVARQYGYTDEQIAASLTSGMSHA
jgi:hypothetical protein